MILFYKNNYSYLKNITFNKNKVFLYGNKNDCDLLLSKILNDKTTLIFNCDENIEEIDDLKVFNIYKKSANLLLNSNNNFYCNSGPFYIYVLCLFNYLILNKKPKISESIYTFFLETLSLFNQTDDYLNILVLPQNNNDIKQYLFDSFFIETIQHICINYNLTYIKIKYSEEIWNNYI